MSISIEVKTVGDGIAIILPQPVIDRLRIRAGDRFTLADLDDGFQVRTDRVDFDRKMSLADAIMREDRDLLRRLAE